MVDTPSSGKKAETEEVEYFFLEKRYGRHHLYLRVGNDKANIWNWEDKRMVEPTREMLNYAIGKILEKAVSAAVREKLEMAEKGLEALRAGEFQYIPDGRWAIDEAIKLLKSMAQEVK